MFPEITIIQVAGVHHCLHFLFQVVCVTVIGGIYSDIEAVTESKKGKKGVLKNFAKFIGVFLSIFRKFYEHLLLRSTSGRCFWWQDQKNSKKLDYDTWIIFIFST